MGKKKVILDTNTLISVLGWDGKPREILRNILREDFELVLSHKQLQEIRRVLDYPKFQFTEEQRIRFLTLLMKTAPPIKTSIQLRIVKEDPDDDRLLEAALESKAHFLITGDKALLRIKAFHKTRIMSASEFLKDYS